MNTTTDLEQEQGRNDGQHLGFFGLLFLGIAVVIVVIYCELVGDAKPIRKP